jgi:hypothetical protein
LLVVVPVTLFAFILRIFTPCAAQLDNVDEDCCASSLVSDTYPERNERMIDASAIVKTISKTVAISGEIPCRLL